MYKRWNNILCNYWQMYKSLREIIVHKKKLRSKVVLPKKSTSSLQVTMFNHRVPFFSEYSVSLFHKSSCCHLFLNGYGMDTVFLEEHLQPWITYIQCIWQKFLFKSYCYFKGALAAIGLSGTVIFSGDYLQ